jgi:hypothetical protein
MGVTRERPARWAAAARLAELLVALTGIFAMHGLSDHGVAGHLEGADAQLMASHHLLLSPGAAAAGPGVENAVHAAEKTTFSTGMGDPDGTGLGLAGVCLAVLAAGMLLAASIVRRDSTDLFRSGAGRIPAAVISQRVRAPDPPNLIRLSIRRC